MPSSSRWLLAGYLVAACFAAAVYWPGTSGGFLFDDFPNLVLDEDWKVEAGDRFPRWLQAAQAGIASDGGRPLAMLSFAVNHAFTGLDPEPMKVTNLVLHLINGGLILMLGLQAYRLAADARSAAPRWAPVALAAAFLLHPLLVSTTLYVVQRMEMAAFSCTLLALLAYLGGRQREIAGERAWPWFLGALSAVAVGLGFKETVLLAPGYAALFELTLLRFRSQPDGATRRWKTAYVLAALLALTVFISVVLPRYATDQAYAFRDFTLYERLLTQPRVLAMYLSQIFWPAPQSLLFYYDHLQASAGWLEPATTLWSTLLLGCLAGVAVVVHRPAPLFALGIGWFFVAHSLTSNVLPLELAFEHRNYPALLGPLLVACELLRIALRRLSPEARVTVCSALLLTLAGLTLLQAMAWSSPQKLAVILASRNPQSARASYSLGSELLASSRGDPASPAWALAKREFEHAASLPGSPPLGEQALIAMLGQAGQPVPRALWESLRSKLARKEAGAEEIGALYALTNCRLRGECRFDDHELHRTLLTALVRNPNSIPVRVQFANFAYNAMADRELAIRVLREAQQLAPRDREVAEGLRRMKMAQKLHK